MEPGLVSTGISWYSVHNSARVCNIAPPFNQYEAQGGTSRDAKLVGRALSAVPCAIIRCFYLSVAE